MKFTELRNNIRNLLQNRKKDETKEISQEDMDLVTATKYEIPKRTVLCFGLLYFLKFSSNYFHLPSLFTNPLADKGGIAFKRKFWSKIMSNHLIFLGTMSCIIVHTVKYEVVKFYLFLKYENLVNMYMDALDRRQIEYLRKLDS